MPQTRMLQGTVIQVSDVAHDPFFFLVKHTIAHYSIALMMVEICFMFQFSF